MAIWVKRHYVQSNGTKFLETATIKTAFSALIAFLKANYCTDRDLGPPEQRKLFIKQFANQCKLANPLPISEKEAQFHSREYIEHIFSLCDSIKVEDINDENFNKYPKVYSWSNEQYYAALSLTQTLLFLRHRELYFTSITQMEERTVSKKLVITMQNSAFQINTLIMYCNVSSHKSSHRGMKKFTAAIIAIQTGKEWSRTQLGKAISLLAQTGKNKTYQANLTWDSIIPPMYSKKLGRFIPLSLYHVNTSIRKLYASMDEKVKYTSYVNRRSSFGILIALQVDQSIIGQCATWRQPKSMLNFYVGRRAISFTDRYKQLSDPIKIIFGAQATAYEIYKNQTIQSTELNLPKAFQNIDPDSDNDSEIGDDKKFSITNA